MIAQEDDPEMLEWLCNAQQKAGHFVSSLADAGLVADWENYPLLRPLLLVMRAKYPQYEPSDEVKAEIKERGGYALHQSQTGVALALCIPVDLAPDFPLQATYSKFEKVDCPDCGKKMWLGERVKAMAAAGAAQITCAVCGIEKHGVREAARLFPLTGKAAS